MADYNQVREDFGLERVTDFSQITSDAQLAQTLEDLYGDVDNIDVWVGGLAEDHVEGSSVGELFSTIIVDQFERIRDGDRLWYENVFSGAQLAAIESTTLADVIERNTDITGLRDNLFFEEGTTQQETAEQPAENQPPDRPTRPGAGQLAETQPDNTSPRRLEPPPAIPAANPMSELASIDINRPGVDAGQIDQNRDTSNRQRTRGADALDNAFADFDGVESAATDDATNNNQRRGRRS